MDAFRFHSLCKHWRESPPVHISVAAYIYGGKKRGDGSPAVQQDLPPSQTAGAIFDSLTGEDDHAR
jgi:hypothetical protein